MILDLRNKAPYIHFGFNRQELNPLINNVVTVYQETIYNDEYSFNWNFTGATLISENKNELKVYYPADGSFTVDAQVTTPDGVVLESEEIIVISKGITWAEKTILFSRTDITFDSI